MIFKGKEYVEIIVKRGEMLLPGDYFSRAPGVTPDVRLWYVETEGLAIADWFVRRPKQNIEVDPRLGEVCP